MSLQWIEGFDYLPLGAPAITTLSALGYYSTRAVNIVAPGRFGYGQCLSLHDVAGAYANRVFTNNYTHAFFGAAIWEDSGAGGTLTFNDVVSGQNQIQIVFGVGGAIHVYNYNGTVATLIGSSPPGSFSEQVWQYLEVGLVMDSVAGSVTVKINTVPMIALTGVRTVNLNGPDTHFNAVQIFGGTAGNATLWDDIYLTDNSGPQNNTYLGNSRVRTQLPSGVGATTDFSRVGATSNWAAARNNLVDDSMYVYDATTNDFDLYTIQALTNSPSIFGVQVKGAYRQDDATQRSGQNLLKSGATTVAGTAVACSSSYKFNYDIWELDPNTSLGWLATNVNAVQIGPKVQA